MRHGPIPALLPLVAAATLANSSRATPRSDDWGPPDRPAWVALAFVAPPLEASAEEETFYPQLPVVHITNLQSGESTDIRLYDVHGAVAPAAALALDELLCDARDREHRRTTTIDRRVLQLLFKAAYHFRSRDVAIVSAYREPGQSTEGRHGEGKAIDFRLRGVTARALASYLRKLARVGVGVYTNARTQFVHLDDRPQSFHWIDASPPGRRWKERSLGGAGLGRRDAAWRCEDDWPEGLLPRPARECATASQPEDLAAAPPTDDTQG